MPDPPSVNPITRFIFESPWPLAGVLLAVAAVVFWTGLRDGRTRRFRVAGILAAIGGAILLAGYLVVTSGERAAAVTRSFVEAVAGSDLVGAVDAIAGDGALVIGAPNNPGLSKEFLTALLSRAAREYTITSNRITSLDGYSQGADEGVVHLACRTEVEGGYGPAVTRWVVVARRQAEGDWQIHRLVWISVNGRDADRVYLP